MGKAQSAYSTQHQHLLPDRKPDRKADISSNCGILALPCCCRDLTRRCLSICCTFCLPAVLRRDALPAAEPDAASAQLHAAQPPEPGGGGRRRVRAPLQQSRSVTKERKNYLRYALGREARKGAVRRMVRQAGRHSPAVVWRPFGNKRHAGLWDRPHHCTSLHLKLWLPMHVLSWSCHKCPSSPRHLHDSTVSTHTRLLALTASAYTPASFDCPEPGQCRRL